MSFADTGMALVALTAQQLGAYESVAYIVFVTIAIDARGMAPAHPDIMQHGCLLEEVCVQLQLRMTAGYEQAAVGHLSRVLQEQATQVVILRVVLI